LVFLQEGCKSIEAFGPEFLIAIEPFIGVVHRLCTQLAAHDAAILFAGDQPGIRQHIEMLHHRRQRHRKRLGQFADRQAVGFAQAHHQGAPGWIGECSKRAVQIWLQMVNHMVKYRPVRIRVKAAELDFNHSLISDA